MNANADTITVFPIGQRPLKAGVHFGNFIFYSFALVVLTTIIFGTFKLLQIPVGQMIDWVIGFVSFWWLLVIITVPWNICFQAKETLVEAAASLERGIAINEKQILFVRKIAIRSLIMAIALHIFSAIVLFVLAEKGISPVGYVGSVVALLLTALRPSVRAYEYLWARLAVIRGQIVHPREDVIELRQRFEIIEIQLKHLNDTLDENRENSWANNKANSIKDLHNKFFNMKTTLENLKEQNEKDHQRITRETRSAVTQLTTDSQFLDHVREIIRFFKTT
jgi:hypothetical protein